MTHRIGIAVTALALVFSACGKDSTTQVAVDVHGLRIVNAYTRPVDVLVDGTLAASAISPGAVDSVPQEAGGHAVAFRATGTTGLVTLNTTTGTGALRTLVVVRNGASFSAGEFGDTNAIVAAGKTKVRVFHLAPNAGEIQVFRTQPDWSTPIEWQFPFLYDSALTDPLAHPYYESTVGTWDIRAWRKPSEVALGWSGTTARVSFALASGGKATVVVLDDAGGGIKVAVLDQ